MPYLNGSIAQFYSALKLLDNENSNPNNQLCLNLLPTIPLVRFPGSPGGSSHPVRPELPSQLTIIGCQTHPHSAGCDPDWPTEGATSYQLPAFSLHASHSPCESGSHKSKT